MEDPLSPCCPSAQVDRLAGTLQSLREAIWKKRPILGDIMGKHGEKILAEYAKDFLDVNPTPQLDARKGELIACVEELVTKRLGADVARGVVAQLRRLPVVSTADHHAPINHPFWVNANLISALPYAAANIPELQYLVVFPFASVSLNNASGYPRGVTFHGGMDGSRNLIRLPILPDKLKMGVVHGMRAFTADDLARASKDVQRRVREGEIVASRAEAVQEAMNRFFAAPDVLAESEYSAQITKINYRLWPELFHCAAGGPPKTERLPDLIYLEIETIVTQLLLRHHFRQSASLIHRVLFDAAWRNAALRWFDGIHGAFSAAQDTGTFFFWLVDEGNRRVRLRLQGDALVAEDGSVTIPITPDSLETMLVSKRIYPSMMLCYLTVALYYGMKCLGGFCQVHDLTVLKEAWQSLLREAGESAEADAITPVQTKELGGDGMVLAYTRSAEGDLVPATGLDMLVNARETSFSKYENRSRTVTLSEMMNAMLPEIYSVLYTAAERDPLLCLYTPEDIMRGTGLQEKLLRETEVAMVG